MNRNMYLWLRIVSEAGSRNWQNYRSGSGCWYQHSDTLHEHSDCVRLLKNLWHKGALLWCWCFWDYIIWKSRHNSVWGSKYVVCLRITKQTKSVVIVFDVIYREHYSISRKDIQPFSTSSVLKPGFLTNRPRTCLIISRCGVVLEEPVVYQMV